MKQLKKFWNLFIHKFVCTSFLQSAVVRKGQSSRIYGTGS